MNQDILKQHMPALIILGILAVLVVVMILLIYQARWLGPGTPSQEEPAVAEETPIHAGEEEVPYVLPPSMEEREAQVEAIKGEENPEGLTAEERRAQSAALETEQNPNDLSREERQAQIEALEGR